MLEHVIDNISTIDAIDHAYIVTNAKFVSHFEQWAANYRGPNLHFGFTIVNDGSTDDSNKLGAIGDMHLVMKKHEIDDDIIVVGGDNPLQRRPPRLRRLLLAEERAGHGRLRRRRPRSHQEIQRHRRRRRGRILFFEEAGAAKEHAHRHRALLLPAIVAAVDSPVHRGR